MAVAKHQESQAEIREVFLSGCEQDTDILHSSYSDLGREELPANYPDFDCAFFYNSSQTDSVPSSPAPSVRPPPSYEIVGSSQILCNGRLNYLFS